MRWSVVVLCIVGLSACQPVPSILAECETAMKSEEPAGFSPEGCHPAPGGNALVRVRRGAIDLLTREGVFPAGSIDGGRVVWAPDSSGFIAADYEGSGQTETFRYVDVSTGRPLTIVLFREAAVKRFKQVFRCRDGFYANTLTDGWTADGKVRLVVQNGVHSEGCVFDEEIMIGVLGNPVTGVIDRVLSGEEVRAEWCTSEEHTEFGYCYEEEAYQRAHPESGQGVKSPPAP